LDEARRLADAGQPDVAASRLQELLDAPTAVHEIDRLYLLGSWMTICSRLGQAYETLTLARDLAGRLEERGEFAAAAGCLATQCETLTEFGDARLMRVALARLDQMLSRLAPEDGAMAREAALCCAFRLALEERESSRALRLSEQLAATERTSGDRHWRRDLILAMQRVELSLATDMPRPALQTLAEVRRATQQYAEPLPVLQWMALRCHEAAGEGGRAEGAARTYLALLDRLGARPAFAARRMHGGADLAAWFGRREGYAPAARRSLSLAASAAVARAQQLSAAVARFESLDVDPRAAVTEARALSHHFGQTHAALVAEFLLRSEGAPDRGPASHPSEDAGLPVGIPIELCVPSEL